MYKTQWIKITRYNQHHRFKLGLLRTSWGLYANAKIELKSKDGLSNNDINITSPSYVAGCITLITGRSKGWLRGYSLPFRSKISHFCEKNCVLPPPPPLKENLSQKSWAPLPPNDRFLDLLLLLISYYT